MSVDGAAARRSALGVIAALLILLVGAGLHVWYLVDDCPLDLAGDEAHYWEWSRRLDWSYYSKGPLVAYLIALGRRLLGDWSIGIVGSEMLAVRAPAILLSIGTGFGLFVLARSVFGSARVALGAVLLSCTAPILAAGSFLMTIDAPLMFCWTWTLVCVESALRTGRAALWGAAGVLTAVGILAKYTMVLIAPVLLLAFFLAPTTRVALRRPGPYLAAAIGLLGFAPILIWNQQHDWVSFRHVAGQAGVAGGTRFNPLGVVEYVAGQAMVVNPIWFVGMLAALWVWLRRPDPIPPETHDRASVLLLAAAAIVPWAVFLAFSPITKIQPNWPVQAVVPAIPLLAAALARGMRGARNVKRRLSGCVVAGAAVGIGMVVVAHRTEWLAPVLERLTRQAPPWELTPAARFDPTARLRGWSRLAAVDEILAAERQAGREPFLLADDYQLASELAFYCPSHPPVYCAQSALGQRRSQYDLWPNPIRDAAMFVGRPCLYVGSLRPEIVGDEHRPAALPDLQKVATIEHSVRGLRYQLWSVYRCDSFAGFRPRAGEAARY